SASAAAGASRPIRPMLLVIEDDSDARDIMRRALTPFGYDLKFASNAADGLAMARQARPAALLADLGLPDMHGLEIVEAIKGDSALAEIPLIVVSASEDRASSIAAGACDHLVKPLARDTLTAAVLRFAAVDSSPALAREKAAIRVSD